MSPSSTEQRNRLVRKIAICAAALAVTVLPSACTGAAFAESGGFDRNGETVREVGAAGDADDEADDEADAGDEDDAAADGDAADGADNGAAADDDAEEGAADGGAEDAAGEDAAGDQEAPPEGEEATGDDIDGEPNAPVDGEDADAGGAEDDNGLDVLGTDCTASDLPPHEGFEEAPRCVDTSFGEVASEEQSPSLLITDSPENVQAGETFNLGVSTRNLIRDRFLGAAAGGYYLESSFLDEDGIQRGHFHTACRMLDSVDAAPDAAPAPEFFLATQDNGGGAGADTVNVTVEDGMPEAGTAQCAVWAGDGSHRVPMMQRANQTPAFDAVRITVE